MKESQALERIAQIKQIMEQAAVYHHRLAPEFLLVGSSGMMGAAAAIYFHIDTVTGFLRFWMIIALCLAVLSAVLMSRRIRQAGEPLWGGVSLRLANVQFPPLLVGACFGMVSLIREDTGWGHCSWLVSSWLALFGIAQISASANVLKGLRGLGWLFILAGLGWLIRTASTSPAIEVLAFQLHLLMGATFGFFHLGYGFYLLRIERS
jgi:hypothetical protein